MQLAEPRQHGGPDSWFDATEMDYDSANEIDQPDEWEDVCDGEDHNGWGDDEDE